MVVDDVKHGSGRLLLRARKRGRPWRVRSEVGLQSAVDFALAGAVLPSKGRSSCRSAAFEWAAPPCQGRVVDDDDSSLTRTHSSCDQVMSCCRVGLISTSDYCRS